MIGASGSASVVLPVLGAVESARAYTSWCVERMGVGVAAGLEVRDDLPFPVVRGIVASRPAGAGAVLANIPLAALLTAPAARAAPASKPFFAALEKASPALSEDDTLALALLFERFVLCERSRWAGLIAAAPRDFDLPFCWDDEELSALDGSGLGVVARVMRAQAREDFAALSPRVNAAAIAVGAPALLSANSGFTLDNYVWALSCVWSRGVSLPLPTVGARMTPPALVKTLAPFFEMFNTRSGSSVRHGYDAARRALVVITDAPVRQNTQVCLDYGARPTRDLIRLHGFAVPRNPAETYRLEMRFRADALDFERRVALLRVAPPRDDAGAPAGERGSIALADGGATLYAHFDLAENTWADACMRFLRTMVAPPAILDELASVMKVDLNGGVNVELELQVLRLLASSFVDILGELAARPEETTPLADFEADAAAAAAVLAAGEVQDAKQVPADDESWMDSTETNKAGGGKGSRASDRRARTAAVAASVVSAATAAAAEAVTATPLEMPETPVTAAVDVTATATTTSNTTATTTSPSLPTPVATRTTRERRLQLAAYARLVERRILESQLAMVEDAIAELREVVTNFQAEGGAAVNGDEGGGAVASEPLE